MPCSQNTAISRESTAEPIVQRCNLYRVLFINSPEPHHPGGEEQHRKSSEWVSNCAARAAGVEQSSGPVRPGSCSARLSAGGAQPWHTHLSSARLATCSPSWLKHTERTQRSLAPPAKMGVGGGNRCLRAETRLRAAAQTNKQTNQPIIRV